MIVKVIALAGVTAVMGLADPRGDLFPRAFTGDGLCSPRAIPFTGNFLAKSASTDASIAMRQAPKAHRRRSLFARQEVCPSNMPQCGPDSCVPQGGTCCHEESSMYCPAGYVCSANTRCCPSDNPDCQSGGGGGGSSGGSGSDICGNAAFEPCSNARLVCAPKGAQCCVEQSSNPDQPYYCNSGRHCCNENNGCCDDGSSGSGSSAAPPPPSTAESTTDTPASSPEPTADEPSSSDSTTTNNSAAGNKENRTSQSTSGPDTPTSGSTSGSTGSSDSGSTGGSSGGSTGSSGSAGGSTGGSAEGSTGSKGDGSSQGASSGSSTGGASGPSATAPTPKPSVSNSATASNGPNALNASGGSQSSSNGPVLDQSKAGASSSGAGTGKAVGPTSSANQQGSDATRNTAWSNVLAFAPLIAPLIAAII